MRQRARLEMKFLSDRGAEKNICLRAYRVHVTGSVEKVSLLQLQLMHYGTILLRYFSETVYEALASM